MAFSGISAQQELNQRKILEDIQLKKHQMLQKGASTGSVTIPPYMQMTETSNPIPPVQLGNYGYFISQESAFGNTILPVLPRYDNAK